MATEDQTDQFQLLEDRVDALIRLVESLRSEKAGLSEQVSGQEKRVSDLSAEVEQLRGASDEARRRIAALLKKIERLEL
jgi:FtsZ-binding cell division protein ZapB